METPEQAARRIFGQRAANYTTSATHTDPVILSRVAELAQLSPDDLALDIGTGTGHTAFALASTARTVIGLDLTPQMLAQAFQLRSERAIHNVVFTIADAHHLPFPNGTFQAITCRRTAHHFSQIHRALAEMHRLLRPGGRLVIDDRSVPEDDFVDSCMNELDTYHDESHIRQYRPSEWSHMLASQGFTVETLEPYTQHRALESHTQSVSPENVQKILSRLNSLTSEQKNKLNLKEIDGRRHYNHWYLTIGATRS